MSPQETDALLRATNHEEQMHLDGIYTDYETMEVDHYSNGMPVYRFSYHTDELKTIFQQKKALPDYYNMAVIKQDRYEAVPLHVHDWIELCYVYSGSCTLTIRGEELSLKEGELVLISSNTLHALSRCGENDILVNFVLTQEYLNTAFLQRLAQDSMLTQFLVQAFNSQAHEQHYIFFHASPGHRLASFILLFLCEFYDPSIASTNMLDSLMSLIICELINLFEIESQRDASHANSLFAILRYIELNCTTCTLKETATHFGMHPNYFSAWIKEQTGKSYKELVQAHRLQQAAYLLRSTKLSTAEICFHIGYQNTGFFFQKFQKYYGCTPKEYRKTQNSTL